ncbi:MAG: winged helix-turn-helix transcriptional regulator [Erysipelotrichaceae bacterium]|nr:winged helix-turn-helix transcriptional regulator [Erysipelotrichaceae bacterium]
MGFGETLKALSDPIRRQILDLLKDGKMSAGDIAANFDMTQATVSYHLSILKKADLLFETREKNYIYYELNTTVFEDLINWMMSFKKEETE